MNIFKVPFAKIYPIVLTTIALCLSGCAQNSQTEEIKNAEILDSEKADAAITETHFNPESEAVEKVNESVKSAKVHTNFDHVAKSLTRYLLKDFGEIAMVENCPGGYTFQEGEIWNQDGGVYRCTDPEKRWLEFEWLDGTVVKAPQEVSLDYLFDRMWVGGSTFQSTLSPDFKRWLYLDWVTEKDPTVRALNTQTGEIQRLMSFLPSANHIRFVGTNETGTRFALLVAYAEEGNEEYWKDTKVYVFDQVDGQFINKRSYEISVAADQSPNNGPFFFIDWEDENTITYLDSKDFKTIWANNPINGVDLTEDLGKLFWDLSQRNSSEYVHRLSVKAAVE